MPRPTPLSAAAIDQILPLLPGWTHGEGRLHRTFEFPSFVEAFAFMTKVAFAAERLDHHPNWTNVWAKVDVTLWTHDVGGVTELDLELAKAMNRAA